MNNYFISISRSPEFENRIFRMFPFHMSCVLVTGVANFATKFAIISIGHMFGLNMSLNICQHSTFIATCIAIPWTIDSFSHEGLKGVCNRDSNIFKKSILWQLRMLRKTLVTDMTLKCHGGLRTRKLIFLSVIWISLKFRVVHFKLSFDL